MGWGGRVRGGGSQGGSERRVEVIVKIQKLKFRAGVRVKWGQGGSEQGLGRVRVRSAG